MSDDLPEETTYLVKVSDNWADEMDVAGLFLVTETEWRKYLDFLNARGYVGEVSVGTNQEIDYEEVSDYLKRFKLREVNRPEIAMLYRILGLSPCEFYSDEEVTCLSGRVFGECLLPEFETE